MTRYTYQLTDFPPGLVAVPAQEWMWTECAEAFAFLPQGFPPGTGLRFGRQSSSPAWNRNRLIEDFLRDAPACGWEWICFIDSDMIVPPAAIPRLLSHNVDCVGALYYSRREPLVPEVARLPDDPKWSNADGPLKRVLWVGAGCLLVRRRVFDRLAYPWFEHPGTPGEGEDILFAKKLQAVGIPVHVDLALSAGHARTQIITRQVADAYLASPEGQAARAVATAGSRAYGEAAERYTADALERATASPSGASLPLTR